MNWGMNKRKKGRKKEDKLITSSFSRDFAVGSITIDFLGTNDCSISFSTIPLRHCAEAKHTEFKETLHMVVLM